MKLTKVMEVWEELHTKNTGEIDFADLEKAIDKIVGVDNDVPSVILPAKLCKIGKDG